MGKSPIKDTYAWKSALTVSGGKALAINATVHVGKSEKIYLGNSTTKDTHGKSSLKKSGRKSTTRTVHYKRCFTIQLTTRGIVHVE